MRVGNEVVDAILIFDEERLYVSGVEIACPLSLGQDEVSQEEETNGAVERDPGKKGNIGFEKEKEREGRPVLKPRD